MDGMNSESSTTVSKGAWHHLTTLIVVVLLTIPAAVVRGDEAEAVARSVLAALNRLLTG